MAVAESQPVNNPEAAQQQQSAEGWESVAKMADQMGEQADTATEAADDRLYQPIEVGGGTVAVPEKPGAENAGDDLAETINELKADSEELTPEEAPAENAAPERPAGKRLNVIDLNAEVPDDPEKVEAKDKAVAEAQEDAAGAKAETAPAAEKVANAEKPAERSESREKFNELKEKAETKIEELKQKLDDLEAKLKGYNEAREKNDGRLQELDEALRENANRQQELEGELGRARLETQRADQNMKAKTFELTREMAENKLENADKIQSLYEELGELIKGNKESLENYQKIEQDAEANKDKRTEMRNERANARIDRDLYNNNIKTWERQRENLQGQIDVIAEDLANREAAAEAAEAKAMAREEMGMSEEAYREELAKEAEEIERDFRKKLDDIEAIKDNSIMMRILEQNGGIDLEEERERAESEYEQRKTENLMAREAVNQIFTPKVELVANVLKKDKVKTAVRGFWTRFLAGMALGA